MACFMACGEPLRKKVVGFLDEESYATMLQVSTAAVGASSPQEEARKLAVMSSVVVQVNSLSNTVLLRKCMKQVHTIRDLQYQLAMSLGMRRTAQVYMMPTRVLPIHGHVTFGTLVGPPTGLQPHVVQLTMLQVTPTCSVCGSQVHVRFCTGCWVRTYCSRSCQAAHWNTHRSFCRGQ